MSFLGNAIYWKIITRNEQFQKKTEWIISKQKTVIPAKDDVIFVSIKTPETVKLYLRCRKKCSVTTISYKECILNVFGEHNYSNGTKT